MSMLHLDILTPHGAKRQGLAVAGVEIPSELGELGILPDHEALVVPVIPGVLRFREGERSVRIAVSQGFLRLDESGHVRVVVEQAVEAQDVDAATVREQLASVEDALKANTDSIETAAYGLLSTEAAWLQAQLRAAAN